MTKFIKNKIKLFNKLLIAVAFVLSFSTLCMSLFGGSVAYAASEKQSWSNLNFDDNNNVSNVYTNPTGWTRQLTNNKTTSGAINISKYNDSFYLNSSEDLPEKRNATADNHVLMINSQSANSKVPNNQYYTNTSALKLDAYSHYKVTVWVEVAGGGQASVYITGLDDVVGFTKINAKYASTWRPYTFYISTGIESEEIKTELWLGAKGGVVSEGVVYFDNIEAYKISNNELPNITNTKENYITTPTSVNDTVKHINLNSSNKQIIPNINGTFENVEENNTNKNYNLNAWTKSVSQMKYGTYAEIVSFNDKLQTGKNLSDIGSDLTKNNKNALVLYTKEDVKSYLGLKSDEITLGVYETVKVSVNVKVADLNGGSAYVRFIENDVLDAKGNKVEGITPVTKEIEISSNSANALQNNYTTCSFYIKGRSLYNTSFKIELALGKSDKETSGIAVFDNISIEPISDAKFTGLSADTNNVSVELQATESEYGITNATFNAVKKEDATLTYPLIPKDWTHDVSDKNNVFFGVINTYDSIYANYQKVSGFANPGNPEGFLQTSESTNNILVMHNINNAYQSVTSSSFDVSANKYYKISFDYKLLQSASSNLLTVQVIDDKNNVLYSDNTIQSSINWEKYTIYVSTNAYTNNLKVKLSLGTNDNLVRGVVYIDNVLMLEQTDLTKEAYETLSKTENVLDFQEGNFNLVEHTDEYIKNPLRYTKSLEVGQNGESGVAVAFGGIIDGNDTSNEQYHTDNSQDNTHSLKYMMMIEALDKATYSLTANDSLSLTSGNYYKFTINAKTIFSSKANESDKNYGAEFGLAGLDKKITNIVTSEWKAYTIYGRVYFDNYTYETIDSDTFNKDKLNNSDDSSFLFVGNTDSDEDKDTTTSNGVNLEAIWFIAPSLILGLALIIALVAYFMKKVKIKKWEKRKVNEYDRETTVHRDVIRKDAEKIRDAKVAELKQEIEKLEQEVEELKAKHSEKVNEARKDRASGVSKKAEKEFKAYAKYSTALENKIAGLNKEIANMNTAEYLLSVQHKLAVEKAKQERLAKEKAAKQNSKKK